MYLVRDKERPEVRAYSNYFRTLEEAQEHVGRSRMVDRDGEHPGEEYLEIVEVERESRPCRYCGAEVQSDDPDCDHCRGCHYSGRRTDDLRADQIAFFERELPGCCVGTEHTGGGCFWMAFHFDGDEDDFYIATDGEASLPVLDGVEIRDGWGYVGIQSRDEDRAEYEGVVIAEPQIGGKRLWEDYDSTLHDIYWNEYPQHCLSDRQVVDAIKADREFRRRLQAGEESEWYVTATPSEPSLEPMYVGPAVSALDALDKAMDEECFAHYSDIIRTADASPRGALTWLGAWDGDPDGLWATFANYTIFAGKTGN